MMLLAGMIGGDQVLAPILNQFYRALQPQRRDTDQHVLWVELAAYAESAADMPLVEMHGRWIAAQHAGDLVAVPVQHFGGAMQLQNVAGGVVAADCAARLH